MSLCSPLVDRSRRSQSAHSQGRRRKAAAGPEPDPSFTPSDVVPDAPIPEPFVRGRRAGDDVTFTWRVVGGTKAGDTWVWRRPDTGESSRGTQRRLTVTEAGRVCLQVQLVREGEPSTSTQQCVE